MVLLMVNEAARCLEEEIVPDPADVDFAMIMGTGFAPFRGGPLRYADSIGITNIVDSMNRLADSGATHLSRVVCCAIWQPLRRIFINPELESSFMIATKPPVKEQARPSTDEPRDLIDTSKMSNGQRAALELTEAARETTREDTFASGLFMGSFDLSGIDPFPMQSTEDRDQGDAFLNALEKLLREKVDPDEIDRTGEIPAGSDRGARKTRRLRNQSLA